MSPRSDEPYGEPLGFWTTAVLVTLPYWSALLGILLFLAAGRLL